MNIDRRRSTTITCALGGENNKFHPSIDRRLTTGVIDRAREHDGEGARGVTIPWILWNMQWSIQSNNLLPEFIRQDHSDVDLTVIFHILGSHSHLRHNIHQHSYERLRDGGYSGRIHRKTIDHVEALFWVDRVFLVQISLSCRRSSVLVALHLRRCLHRRLCLHIQRRLLQVRTWDNEIMMR